MIAKHQQLFRHDPDNGVYGDCFRTVIACLLQLAPQDVPHFCDGPDDGGATERLRAFLRPRGLVLIEFPFDADQRLQHILEIGKHYSQGLYWTLSGMSRNRCNHIVICKGDEIVHDTSIDQSGIVGPGTDDLWWMGFLVRVAPCDEGIAA